MAVHELELPGESAPLARARLRRGLTVEEAARRAGLRPEEIVWLEEGRVYRFPSTDSALLATLLYATALELDLREAKELAGLPAPPRARGAGSQARLLAVAALTALVVALFAVVFPGFGLRTSPAPELPAPARGPSLPPPWRISVDVLNGNGDINWTRQVASRIGAMGYSIRRVVRADRFDYPQTAVYYERGGQPVAVWLARQLRVATRPLPGGENPRRLVVVVGPRRGPD